MIRVYVTPSLWSYQVLWRSLWSLGDLQMGRWDSHLLSHKQMHSHFPSRKHIATCYYIIAGTTPLDSCQADWPAKHIHEALNFCRALFHGGFSIRMLDQGLGMAIGQKKKNGTLHNMVANWHMEVIYTACKILLYIGHNWVILSWAASIIRNNLEH